MSNNKLSQRLQDWVETRKRFRLSHAHVQMARELGMNRRKLAPIRRNHEAEELRSAVELLADLRDLAARKEGNRLPAAHRRPARRTCRQADAHRAAANGGAVIPSEAELTGSSPHR